MNTTSEKSAWVRFDRCRPDSLNVRFVRNRQSRHGTAKLIPLAVSLVMMIPSGLPPRAAAQTLAADEILDRVDRNAVPKTMVLTSEMTVHGRRSSRTIKARSWIEGDDKAFTEYLHPPREKGVKMLKLGDRLWTYSPSTDRTISISGHMLRQSVMGSDLSYEDMMENNRLRDAYAAEIAAEETRGDRPCWVLELKAVKDDVAYHARKIWVDRERFIVLREERYGRGGRLLKVLDVHEVKRIGGRWVQTQAVFKDALKEGAGTEFKIESVEFDIALPAGIFDKSSLKK